MPGARHQLSAVAENRSTSTTSTPVLENLSTDPYCDDFQCTSSPAVELGVRSFARDLTRLRLSPSLFGKDVTYSDGFRSFTGSEKYSRQRWYLEALTKPTAVIQRMQMLQKDIAQIDWQVSGGSLGGQITIPVTSTIQMNLLTGRIISHTERWDLSKVPAPASSLLPLSRMLWSAQQAGQDTMESLNTKVGAGLSSLDGGDKGPDMYSNPADPTRFFQNQGNDQWNDYVSYATVAALLYFVFRAFGEVAKL